jgi:plastocyanin
VSVAALAVGALLVPAAAQAATKPVFAGTPPKGAIPGVPETTFDNAFYPRSVKIHKGDKIKFSIVGFHNVLFSPKGKTPPSFVVPAGTVSGLKDAAGADFWFNGQAALAPNGDVFAPTGGKTVTGKKLVGSGVGGKPFKWKFTRKGKFTILCSIHAGMTLKVDVKGKKAKVPSKKADAKRVAKQVKSAKKLAKKLVAFQGPAGDAVQAGSDQKGVASLAFYPTAKTVKVGVPVTFSMPKSSTEIHNVAFGPDDYLAGLAKAFEQSFDATTIYPSEPFGTPLVDDGTQHGNGFVNTGVMDTDSASPFPSSSQITFTKPGTYKFICTVHGPVMSGTLTVTP